MAISRDNEIVIKYHRPDQKERFFFFISGIIVSIPLSVFFEEFINSLSGSLPIFYAAFFSLVVFAPFVEEFAKVYPLFYRHGETEKSIFSLGLLVGSGFGVSEFLLYVVVYQVPVFLRLTGLIFHIASTSITAYGITKKQPIQFYLVAAMLHALHNYLVVYSSFSLLASYGIALIACYISWNLYSRTSETPVETIGQIVTSQITEEIQFCPYCGAKVILDSKFCHNCGKQLHSNSR